VYKIVFNDNTISRNEVDKIHACLSLRASYTSSLGNDVRQALKRMFEQKDRIKYYIFLLTL
jgi:hypothetical protein